MQRAKLFRRVRRVVIKIGTGVLTSRTGGIDRGVFQGIAAESATLLAGQTDVVIVSSGAIALGVGKLGYAARPKRMDALQACAAAGQTDLMRCWADAFAAHGRVTAQVLLTHADLADRKRFLNARRALVELSARGAVPVINENDTVSVDEIAFGDNDALSAQVANLVGADVLVMLSVAEGLLDGDARVRDVLPGDRTAERLVRKDTSVGGTGGMSTKVRAARSAANRGTIAVIAPGKMPGVLGRLFAGEDVGTVFDAATARLASRASWIADTLRPRGTIIVDDGARNALVHKSRSLLPSGVIRALGNFGQGAAVEIADVQGRVFARGLTAYSAKELEVIAGRRTGEIEALLGYHLGDEAVHRDDLVILE